MAANILDELDDIFDATTVQRTAEALGESPEAITACIRPAVAELLRAIIKRCESRDAADKVLDTIAEFEGAVSGNYYLILEAGSTAETIELGYRASSTLYRDNPSALVYSLLRIASISRPGAESLFHLLTALVADVVGTVHARTPFRSDVLPMYLRKQQDIVLSSIPGDILFIMGFVDLPKPKALSQDQLGLNAFVPGPSAVDFTPPIRETEFSNELLRGDAGSPDQSQTLDDVSAGFSAIEDYQADGLDGQLLAEPDVQQELNEAAADEIVDEQTLAASSQQESPDLPGEQASESSSAATQEEVIREIVRRQQLRDQLRDNSLDATSPLQATESVDGNVANERQRELRELLNGGLGAAMRMPDEMSGMGSLDDGNQGEEFLPEDAQYLEEIDDQDHGEDDFLEEREFELSTEQNLEIRFKAMIVGVLLSLSWLYAFATGQRRDLQLAHQAKAAVTTDAELAGDFNRPHPIVIDQSHVEALRLAGGGEAQVQSSTGESDLAVTSVDREPMRLPPIRWTDASQVALQKETDHLLSSIGATDLQTTAQPSEWSPALALTSPTPQSFVSPRKEWDTVSAGDTGEVLIREKDRQDQHAVTVRFESVEEESTTDGIVGFRVVDGDFKIPVFDAPRETGSSYYSN